MRAAELRTLAAGALLLGMLGWPAPGAQARPSYFDVFTDFYGISEGQKLNACGVCHFRWEGTGARNLYGSAVEQQLYLGKGITQSLQDVDAEDSDADGFSNSSEILTFETLPGYSCDNFFEAIGAPLDHHSYITPRVASCLEPLDIRLTPTLIAIFADVGDVKSVTLTILNNGSDLPLTVSSLELLPGSHIAFSLEGPDTPFEIPVGGDASVNVVFAPTAPALASGTLRISSNDPDEAQLDVRLTALAVIHVVAPPEERALCLSEIHRRYRRYVRKHLREWQRCYLDEVRGVACDTGRRDLKLQRAEIRLRAGIGGPKDRSCAPNALTPSRLDFPDSCGGACGHIQLNRLRALADCLVCREEEALRAALTSSMGTAPPDLPPNLLVGQAARCQAKLTGAVLKGIGKIQKQLGRCELENILAVVPVDCTTEGAALITQLQGRINVRIDQCSDTTGLLGCLFPDDPNRPVDPGCLGNDTLSIGSGLIDASFGLEE